MEWIVYRYDSNKNKIEPMNILKGWNAKDYSLKKIKKKCKTEEEFSKELRHEMMYHYWSRCEWELLIKRTEDNHIYLIPWCGCRNPEEVKIDVTNFHDFDWQGFADKHIKSQIFNNEAKIDVFDQIEYRWDEFVSYCWFNK